MLNQNNKPLTSPGLIFRSLAKIGLAALATFAPVQFNPFNPIEESISWSEAKAETIYKKDGSVVSGKIINQTRESVTIQTPQGNIVIGKDQIRRIQYSDNAEQQKIEQERLRQQQEQLKKIEEQKKMDEAKKLEDQKKLDDQKKSEKDKAEAARLAEINKQNESKTKLDSSFSRPAWKNAVYSGVPIISCFDQLGMPRPAAYSMCAADTGMTLRTLDMAGSKVRARPYWSLNPYLIFGFGSGPEMIALDAITKSAKLNTAAQFLILASRSGSNSGGGSSGGSGSGSNSGGPSNPLELLTFNQHYEIRTLFGRKVNQSTASIFEYMPASMRLAHERDVKNRLIKRYGTEYIGSKIVMGGIVYLINRNFFRKSAGQADSDSGTYFYASANPGFGGEQRSVQFAFVNTF